MKDNGTKRMVEPRYVRPVEAYEAPDLPAPRVDPVKRILAIVLFFAFVQWLTLLGVAALLWR